MFIVLGYAKFEIRYAMVEILIFICFSFFSIIVYIFHLPLGFNLANDRVQVLIYFVGLTRGDYGFSENIFNYI